MTKVCPKCNSTYTDETLNYCLTDGVPLVYEASDGEKSSGSWQEADTIFDANLKIHTPDSHVTSPNSINDTTPKLRVNTGSFSTTQNINSRSYLFPLAGVLLTLSLIGGIFWWLYNVPAPQQNIANKANTSESKVSTVKRSSVQLTPERQNIVKKEVTDLLEEWRKSIERRDADANVKFYIDTLETYYKESGIDKNHVRADRQRAIDRYQMISLQLDNLVISPESEESAIAIFDKTWNFKSAVKISTGSVQQEMYFIKQNGKWLISGEKDVKVYYIQNRENQTGNSSAVESGKPLPNSSNQ